MEVGGSGCITLHGATSDRGYSRVKHDGRDQKGHRVAWEHLHGPVPVGLELDHLCRNRACVRPDHMEPVTHAENMARGEVFGSAQRQRTHCPKGHAYDEANTRHANGRRHCRACARDRGRLHKNEE
jgi:hypothetical protein